MARKGREPVPDAVRASWGEKVKALRAALELTQDAVGAAGGFSGREMSAFEQGDKVSSGENQARLAAGFGVPLALLKLYLFGGLSLADLLDQRGADSLIRWIERNEGVRSCISKHNDVTADDIIRLRAQPSRSGEALAGRSPDLYGYILQLRKGIVVDGGRVGTESEIREKHGRTQKRK